MGIKDYSPFDRWEDTFIQAGTEEYKQPCRTRSLASTGPNNKKVVLKKGRKSPFGEILMDLKIR